MGARVGRRVGLLDGTVVGIKLIDGAKVEGADVVVGAAVGTPESVSLAVK